MFQNSKHHHCCNSGSILCECSVWYFHKYSLNTDWIGYGCWATTAQIQSAPAIAAERRSADRTLRPIAHVSCTHSRYPRSPSAIGTHPRIPRANQRPWLRCPGRRQYLSSDAPSFGSNPMWAHRIHFHPRLHPPLSVPPPTPREHPPRREVTSPHTSHHVRGTYGPLTGHHFTPQLDGRVLKYLG